MNCSYLIIFCIIRGVGLFERPMRVPILGSLIIKTSTPGFRALRTKWH